MLALVVKKKAQFGTESLFKTILRLVGRLIIDMVSSHPWPSPYAPEARRPLRHEGYRNHHLSVIRRNHPSSSHVRSKGSLTGYQPTIFRSQPNLAPIDLLQIPFCPNPSIETTSARWNSTNKGDVYQSLDRKLSK